MVKALCLMSGGLDSILAIKILQQQNIKTIALCFETPFFNADKAKIATKQLNIELITVDLTDDHLDIVKNPRYGYGKNMNPCIDCHGLMFKKAKIIASDQQIDIIASGEVLGQRPMSQNSSALQLVAKIAGLENKILRPLSAKLLPATDYEINNLVDRNKLLGLSGRNRKPQLALAEEYKLDFFPTPGGGCKLTGKEFSAKLKQLLSKTSHPSITELNLLSIGRHIWHQDMLFIVTRDKFDSEQLKSLDLSNYFIMKLVNITGPQVIGLFINDQQVNEAQIIAKQLIYQYKTGLDQMSPVFKWQYQGNHE